MRWVHRVALRVVPASWRDGLARDIEEELGARRETLVAIGDGLDDDFTA